LLLYANTNTIQDNRFKQKVIEKTHKELSETEAIKNQKWEYKLFSKGNYQNPYKDVVLTVRYTNEDSSIVYNSNGFWDGDSTFIIRSYFPSLGQWSWKTSCSNTIDQGLHNISGEIIVNEYNEGNKIYEHGGLKVSENKKYITYEDDTPFLWLGGTAWGMPKAATYDEWKTYVDDRHSKKFTIIQVTPAKSHGFVGSDEYGSYPTNQNGDPCFFSDDKWNPPYWQEFDRFIEYANSKEIIVLIAGLGEPVYDMLSQDDAILFTRNLAARMEGYHVILSPSFDTYQLSWNDDYDEIAEEALSGSRHLISQHPGTPSKPPINTFAKYFKSKDYLDISLNQTGHNGGNLTVSYQQAREWNNRLWNEPPLKPIVNTEAYYSAGKYADSISHESYNGLDENARALGWLSWLSGALGYTYGATGIWNYGEDVGNGIIIPLQDALDFTSSTQMKYMYDFFDMLPWWELEPKHSAIISNEQDETKKMAFAISEFGDFGVAYLPDNNSVTINMSVFNTAVNVFWFHPVENTFVRKKQNVLNNGNYTFIPPNTGEWILLLTDTGGLDNSVKYWINDLTVSGVDLDSIVLSYGQIKSASDNIDSSLAESKLPPPVSAYKASFLLQNNYSTLLDYRNSEEKEVTWTIDLHTSYPITFKWEKKNLPFGSFFLRDLIDGAIVNIDMKSIDNYTLTNESVNKLQIIYKEEYEAKIDFDSKWNLVSIPLTTDNMNINSLFQDTTSVAFKYDDGYISVDELENGLGYWVEHKQSGIVATYGNEPNNPINVKPGWNMIGVFNKNINVDDLQTNPKEVIVSNVYGFNNGYYKADSLEVGKGYWVKTNQVGEISFRSSSNQNKRTNDLNKNIEPQIVFNLIATDGFNNGVPLVFGLDSLGTDGLDTIFGEEEFPPPPPMGAFDIRIKMKDSLTTSNSDIRYLETKCYEHLIKYQLSDSSNGLTLNWNLPNGITLNIQDAIGGLIFNEIFDSGESSYTILDTSISEIKLTLCYSDAVVSLNENNALPNKYNLFQNYPNPFNPTTTINYSISMYETFNAVSQLVQLKVYDILGSEVAILVNKKQNAGNYTVHFNATELSNGVYFYRLQTENFTKIKKMILLK